MNNIKALRFYLSIFSIILGLLLCSVQTFAIIKTYPAPRGAALSNAYKVSVSGKPIAVYLAKVGAADPVRRFKAVDDMLRSEVYYDAAAFAYFDMQGSATVTVSVSQLVKTAKVLPSSAGVKVRINGRSVSFTVAKPLNYTIEINGETVKSLHLFINPLENNAPSPKDPNVIYFGPGIHEVSHMVIGDNKTVYVAGGAVIRAVIDPNEHYNLEHPTNFRTYEPTFVLQGHHIRFRGHGIIDASACTTHARSMIVVNGSDITVEGVILVNSSQWTVPLRQCNGVTIDNIKLLSYRANTDGIDICNSQNVVVKNCFVRTNDDLIVIKTDAGQGTGNHIVVKNCVLWNQLANALSLGFELRENVNDVLFTNCDIIHDTGRAWCLGIFNTDASLINNITFDHIRLEEAHQFISVWIGKANESFAQQRGHIKQVTFSNITVTGAPLPIDVNGFSDQCRADDIAFKHIIVNGKPMPANMVRHNQFATVSVQP